MSKLRVEVAQEEAGLASLRREWNDLFVTSSAPPFLSWEWMITWNMWYGKKQSPYVVCVREGKTLIGLLALSADPISMTPFGPKGQKLSFLGGNVGGADYLDILAEPARKQECAIAILGFLSKSKSFDLLELNDLSVNTQLLPLLLSHFGNRDDYGYQLIPQYICPRVNLQSGWNQVLRNSKRADNYRRRLRNLRHRDGFDFRSITSPEESPMAFDRFLKLHESCWAHRGGSGALHDQISREFQREVVTQIAKTSMVRFDELWVEGECRASIYGLDNGHTYYLFLSGYDLDWSDHSVGLVLLGLSLENASTRGVKVYDFLRGNEPYKFDWANDSQMTTGVRVTADRMVARWAISRNYVKEAMRTIRTQNVSQWFRAIRRRLCASTGFRQSPDSAATGVADLPMKNIAPLPASHPSSPAREEQSELP
ncbi:MAG TPA: GNAT family N-acetyltransferase [Blastocatellia bacterium]|jgi:CelD/BcsL family acetyltransferase involved in cellulose biosynthesis|nr:GNAT family N-acetyltransferase [Blastocatellia bacterium]